MSFPKNRAVYLRWIRGSSVLLLGFSMSAIAEVGTDLPQTQQVVVALGYSAMSDTSVPGQEISQKDLPLRVTIEKNRYMFAVSIPYIQRSAPSGKVAKSHHHESKKSEAGAMPIIATAGLGDITSSLAYRILDEADASFSLTTTGEIKLATADVATGLGTGVNDYFFEMAAGKSWGNFSGEMSVGRAILGSPGKVKINDVSKTIYFNNIYYGSLEFAYQLSESLSSGIGYSFGEASEAGGVGQRDLALSVEYKLSDKQALSFEVLRSLSPSITSQTWAVGYSSAM